MATEICHQHLIIFYLTSVKWNINIHINSKNKINSSISNPSFCLLEIIYAVFFFFLFMSRPQCSMHRLATTIAFEFCWVQCCLCYFFCLLFLKISRHLNSNTLNKLLLEQFEASAKKKTQTQTVIMNEHDHKHPATNRISIDRQWFAAQ